MQRPVWVVYLPHSQRGVDARPISGHNKKAPGQRYKYYTTPKEGCQYFFAKNIIYYFMESTLRIEVPRRKDDHALDIRRTNPRRRRTRRTCGGGRSLPTGSQRSRRKLLQKCRRSVPLRGGGLGKKDNLSVFHGGVNRLAPPDVPIEHCRGKDIFKIAGDCPTDGTGTVFV